MEENPPLGCVHTSICNSFPFKNVFPALLIESAHGLQEEPSPPLLGRAAKEGLVLYFLVFLE